MSGPFLGYRHPGYCVRVLLPASLPPSNSMQLSFIWSAIRHPLVGGHAPAGSETALEDFPSLNTLSVSVEVKTNKQANKTHKKILNQTTTQKQTHKPRKKLYQQRNNELITLNWTCAYSKEFLLETMILPYPQYFACMNSMAYPHSVVTVGLDMAFI